MEKYKSFPDFKIIRPKLFNKINRSISKNEFNNLLGWFIWKFKTKKNNINLFYSFLFVIILISFSSCYDKIYVSVPVYENVSIPYVETKPVPTKLPPIVTLDSLVIAFTRFAGGTTPAVEMVSEAIRIGFIQEEKNNDNIIKNIRFVTRGELLRNLTRTELEEMGKKVEDILISKYGINLICTGTILSDTLPKISLEIIDLKADKVYNEVISSYTWERVGIEVAKSFFGTRTIYNQVESTAYRIEKKLVRDDGYYKEVYNEERTQQAIESWSKVVVYGLVLAFLIWLPTAL